jgi:hypothetical protein
MICAVEGCDREVRARGWCNMHYARWYRHGDPLALRPKPGKFHLVPYLDEMDDYGHTFDPVDERHGTLNGYVNLGCRCAPCREANTERHRQYMNASPERLEKHRLRQQAYRAKRKEMTSDD